MEGRCGRLGLALVLGAEILAAVRPIDRARQSLAGLAVGDAFGETLFCDPIEMQRRVAMRLMPPHRPWRWTDDTAMAISIVNVLAQHQTIDQDALMAGFVEHFTAQPQRGYGRGAFGLLTAVRNGAPWRVETQRMFNGQGSFGNGAAMLPRCGRKRSPCTARLSIHSTQSPRTSRATPDRSSTSCLKPLFRR